MNDLENIENIENAESAENGKTSLEALETAVNALVDSEYSNEDNGTNAAFNAEEAYGGMDERIASLESANAKLTELVGKMVTAYGARMDTEGTQGPEAFPPTTVEKSFDQPGTDLPTLSDIVLGS